MQSEKHLCQHNIEKAIQGAFNIRKRHIFDDSIINTGLEISGTALASQDAHELQEFAHREGFKDIVYDFVPNCKWSCINMNKIKVQWAKRIQQVERNGKLYNIIPGKWDADIFHPEMASNNIIVTIKPVKPIEPADPGYLMLPFHTYHVVEDITDLVPVLKFGRITLDCVQPRSLKSVSINRQGIYINRKYRDKVEHTDTVPDCQCVDNYELTIYYGNNILFQEELTL